MLKPIVRPFVPTDHWLFLSWSLHRFGILPTIFGYRRLLKTGRISAPNPLTTQRVQLRPGTSDLDVYNEIFDAKEYQLELGDPAWIIDAGAHIGLASVFFASTFPKARIIAIEPEVENYRLLLENTKAFKNIIPICAGLWSHKTKLRIQDPSVDTWSFRVVEDPVQGDIPALSIDDLLQDHGIEQIDVLKIDIEGSEIEVLTHSTHWIDRTRSLIIELHDRFRPGCTDALRRSLTGYTYDQSVSTESLVLTNIRRNTDS